MRSRLTQLLALLFALALVSAACGSSSSGSDSTSEGSDTTEAGSDGAATDGASSDGEAAAAGDCAVDTLALKTPGQLTVATGEPVFEPWMVNDDPANGEGFESALVYAVASELGIETVEWVRTGFDEAIAPGAKDYDFNIQQYSINAERDKVVDFSDGYYAAEQAIIAPAGSVIEGATTVEALKTARLGAASGTTSLAYIDDIIQPDEPAAVYESNADAKAAFDAGQLDGLVLDLPTAYYVSAVEIEGSSIVGVLPRVDGNAEELGMLFEDGSELTGCINQALATLKSSGAVDALEDEWLNAGGSIPTLTN